jgi:hypothetical protein
MAQRVTLTYGRATWAGAGQWPQNRRHRGTRSAPDEKSSTTFISVPPRLASRANNKNRHVHVQRHRKAEWWCSFPNLLIHSGKGPTMSLSKLSMTLALPGLLAVACVDSPDSTVVPEPKAAIPERVRKFANAVESERFSLRAPGIAMAVVEAGAVTFAFDFGRNDAGKSDPVLSTTLFRIGSRTTELAPLYIDNFLVTVAGQQRPLTFITDETGNYRYARSRPYVATRVP